MPLKPLPFREVRRRLLDAGFVEVNQAILRQAGLSLDEWEAL